MATHSSIPAWKIPWAEESGELLSVGSHRVRHDSATKRAHTRGWASECKGIMGKGLRTQRLEIRIKVKGTIFRSMPNSKPGKISSSQFELHFYWQDT